MKLTKHQKNNLLEYEWDIINPDNDQNCAWVGFEPSDGEIYGEIIELLGLTDTGKQIKLLIVGTQNEED